MTETHGIGRRCKIKASCFQEAFKAIFETKAQKLAMRLRRRLLAASQHQPHRQTAKRICLTSARKRHFRTPHPERTLMIRPKHMGLGTVVKMKVLCSQSTFISNF